MKDTSMPPSGPTSLDHLRLLLAVVDTGSFTAAARATGRSQPAVSYAIATLEGQLGAGLFLRDRRRPVLSPAGEAITVYARRICMLADEMEARVASSQAGVETVLSLAVDTFYPTDALASAVSDMAQAFPSVLADIRVASRDHVLAAVAEKRAMLGLSAIDGAWPQGIEATDFGQVEIVAVAAPGHPLAAHSAPIPNAFLREYVQVSNKTLEGAGDAHDVAVNSARVWRVDDLATQVALVREGIGWAYLPLHAAQGEIAAGRLVRLHPATRALGAQPWSLFHRANQPPGAAGQWLMARLSLVI
ncbi:LysR family transcriptional regulator [Novosphingobium sp. FSY-8]|uniref:LysR family transcriptional regulator n=1 Tax=Novosphingobium ovatum TaxID=1908523 RepID=A0ABW9XAA3_9SPHN|nr:LysR family transcriptional regulator [Novosphingobium ovatum]NBC35461.1 LysR family transcriptional regulator [Novosphingobium ovatum]